MLFYWFPETGCPGDVDLTGTGLVGESVGYAGPVAFHDGRGMLAMEGDGAALALDEARQEWRRCNGGRFWVGWWRGKQPRPEQLARRERIPGHWVTLLDGAEWMVPLARPFAGGEGLPLVTTLDDDGEPVRTVAAKYRALRGDADRIYNAFLADLGGGAILTQDDADAIAVSALGVNYRLGRYEAAALELLDTVRTTDVLRALIDMPTIERMLAEKKTEDVA